MISGGKVRVVTLIVLAVIISATLLGWDVVYEQTLDDKFAFNQITKCF
jgi:hypothetical protein